MDSLPGARTAMAVDAALLAILVAVLLPLRLLSLALRLASGSGGAGTGQLRRSCAILAVTGVLLAAIFALPRDHVRECAAPVPTVAVGGDDEWGFREELRLEVELLRLQIARLESLLDNNSKSLAEKYDALEEDVRLMRAMGLDIQSLINERENIKMKESLSSLYCDNNIKAMENEVQLLKDESRKMNSDIDTVWSVARDTTEKVEALHSDIKKVQLRNDEWGKVNSRINKMWSFAKDTEKKVGGLYSDVKKGFKQTKRKVPFWRD